MRNLTLAAVLASLATVAPVGAAQWITLDPRPMAMGGAFVAVAEGPSAAYWNPAGLAPQDRRWGAEIPFSIRGEFTGDVLGAANDVNDEAERCQDQGSCDGLRNALDRMDKPGNGALADGAVGVDVRYRRFGFFMNSLVETGGSPVVDRVNTTPATVRNNRSRIVVRGAQYTEIGVAYGHPLWKTGLSAGGGLKAIVGRIGYSEVFVVQENPDAEEVLDDFTKDAETSIQPGLDLALLWDVTQVAPRTPLHPRVGLVARNINGPSFDQPQTARDAGEPDNELDPQVRFGLSLHPYRFWNVALDIDMTDNDTLVRGFSSRFLALGTELNVFNRRWINVPLRVGLAKNLSEGDSGLSWSFGFGLELVHVMLDLAAQVSAEQEQIDEGSRDVPTNLAFAAQLATRF